MRRGWWRGGRNPLDGQRILCQVARPALGESLAAPQAAFDAVLCRSYTFLNWKV
jgi:hypothetical protein